ncbi:guanine nucleotide-binding protein subunit gamma 4-like isoform X2 [Magnolia sinica]|uniref:guanine nucleotide-binding protein subunit gamma 4-like isoform X2 n=1 Tax=Magnolia sinica TaxID=86752 RepID=UPI002658069B|nr:guanine nucleotide-binding protein subunit gamma 4-like isoform X2 [Magnolia sinica]
MTTLPAPTPRSPPRYPDLYGKHRKQAELQVLNREIGFLEEELQSLEGLQPASRCCKENQKFHRSFRICKWLRCGHSSNPVLTYVGTLVAQSQQNDPSCTCWPTLKRMKSCFNLSWLCCFSGCTFHLKWPACTCDPARYCKCCCRLPDCRSLPHCCRCRCRCRCHCRPCCCSCSCLEKCWTSCCILPRLSCPDCSCSCEWSCPKCTKVCCCPKCTKVCCCPKCTRNCCIPCCLCF